MEPLRRGLTDLALDEFVTADPTLVARYGAGTARIWREELANRVAHLVEAVAVERPALFVANALWARAALEAREVPLGDVVGHLHALRHVLERELPAEAAAAACACLDEAEDSIAAHPAQIPSLMDRPGQDSTLARLYLLHLLQREKDEAARLVIEAHRGGTPLAHVYTRIIMPALAEIGRMWHLQEASIADEHYCTAATQGIMTQLRMDLPRQAWNGHRALCCGVGGDMHDIGIRMVADLLELDGWQVEFLGANTPAAEVVMSLAPEGDGMARPFDLLAMSASTTLSLRTVVDVVEAVRAMPGPATPILVGGMPFCTVPDLWKAVGADASAACAMDAVEQARALVK